MDQQLVNTARQKIGGYLKDIRLSKQMSLYIVAQRAGMKISQVKSIEEGNTAYTIDSLIKLSNTLNVDLIISNAGN